MKISRLLVAVVCLSLVAGAAFADTASGGLRYSITVSKFENKAGWSGQWDLGDAWGTVLTDLLNQTNRFIVLGEKDMPVKPLMPRAASVLTGPAEIAFTRMFLGPRLAARWPSSSGVREQPQES